jgi:hypothetical protein
VTVLSEMFAKLPVLGQMIPHATVYFFILGIEPLRRAIGRVPRFMGPKPSDVLRPHQSLEWIPLCEGFSVFKYNYANSSRIFETRRQGLDTSPWVVLGRKCHALPSKALFLGLLRLFDDSSGTTLYRPGFAP